jgi:DNA repair exonuclease SbcCD ATPase subunit
MGPQVGADGDPEYTDLQCQHGLYAGWRNELDARVGTLGRARRTAEEAFERHRGTLRRLNESLRVATEWDPVVRGKAKDMSDAVARWLSAYPSGASVSAEVDLDALAKRAHDAARELGARQSELSNRHAPLVSAFNHLERLGRLLRAREALNGFDHVVDLDERETAQRRDARREAWRRVLGEMKAARTQAAEEAGDRALSSDAIRERFTRLMGKFADIDPWLAGLSFDGRDAGTAGAANHGTTQITALSEGQTVLVNLAAALTVASVVAGKEDHLPRWVVLDEPTNALDRDAVRCVADYLGSLTLEDLPSQIFVATFDQEFAQRLQGGAARAGRRIRRIELDRFDREQRGFRMLRDETHAPDDQPRIR